MRSLVLILLGLWLSGCSSSLHHVSEYPYIEPRVSEEGSLYQYVDSLAEQLTDRLKLGSEDSIAISSVVALDDFNQSDEFGRQVSEAMFAALSERKLRTVEPRLTGRLQIDPQQGEFSLSRDAELLKNEFAVTYLVVGSFQQVSAGRHVNVRLVELSSQNVVSAAYAYIPNRAAQGSPQVRQVEGGLERHETTQQY